MATVIVNRMEIEPMAAPADATPEAPQSEPPEDARMNLRELERALAAIRIRAARVEAR